MTWVFVRLWRLGIKSISRDGPARLCPGLGNVACEAPDDGEGLVGSTGHVHSAARPAKGVGISTLLDENGFKLKIPPAWRSTRRRDTRPQPPTTKTCAILAPPSPIGETALK